MHVVGLLSQFTHNSNEIADGLYIPIATCSAAITFAKHIIVIHKTNLCLTCDCEEHFVIC
jgi:hypothetical protein